MTPAAGIPIHVSAGELADRLTILRLKARRIGEPQKLRHVIAELKALEHAYKAQIPPSPAVEPLTQELAAINERLWDAEDRVRLCETRQDFGPAFVAVARSIYRLNDMRSALKSQINRLLGSQMSEEKSYSAAQPDASLMPPAPLAARPHTPDPHPRAAAAKPSYISRL